MSWIVPSEVATISCTLVLALVYLFLYLHYRQRFMGIWACGWCVCLLRHVLELWLQVGKESAVVAVANQVSALASGLLLLWGTYVFLGRAMPRWWIYGSALDALWIAVSPLYGHSFTLLTLPTFLFLGAVYIWTGLVFLRFRGIEGIGKHVTGWAFILWGLHKADYPFLRPVDWLAPWGYLLAAVLMLFIANGILLVYFQRIREELDRSRTELEQIFHTAAGGMRVVDKNFNVLRMNDSFLRLCGLSEDEAAGKKCFEAFPCSLCYTTNCPLTRILGGEDFVQCDSEKERVDGVTISCLVTATPFRGTKGELIGIVEDFKDITERKRAEEALRAANEELELTIEELASADEEIKQQLTELESREKALLESEAKFRKLFHNANDLICLQALTGEGIASRFIEVNAVACRELGYSRDELLAMDPRDVFAEECRGELPGIVRQILRKRQFTFDATLVSKRGNKIPVEISSHLFTLAGERVILSVARDITERKLAEERLRSANRQLLDIIEFLPDATFVIDRNGKVIAWNRAIEEMTGVRKEDIVGRGDYAYALPFYGMPRPVLADCIISGETGKELPYDNIQRRGSALYTEVFAPCLSNGKGAILWAVASPLYDSAGNITGAIESVRDISDRKQMEEQLRYLSLHDSLTKLYNRAYFEEEMRRLAGGRHHPVGIIICDVDGLKLINDTLGHEAGDRLLMAAAGVISGSFREGDMVARIGGDEFAVLLPDSPEHAVKEACRRIREAVTAYNVSNPELPLSMSVGFAATSDKSKDINELYKEADNNMYREKLLRNQSARSSIVQALMKALEARDYITEGHAERLQELMVKMAACLNLDENKIADLRLLAWFHDIGKVGIPDRILFKPGRLTAEEFAEMKRHCEIGHRIAQSAPDLEPIADLILKHHEWWDGRGYPLGLKGEEIPLECRILAVADAYDAMTNDRPYRKALTHENAVAELRRCSGAQFDPPLVDLLIQTLEAASQQ